MTLLHFTGFNGAIKKNETVWGNTWSWGTTTPRTPGAYLTLGPASATNFGILNLACLSTTDTIVIGYAFRRNGQHGNDYICRIGSLGGVEFKIGTDGSTPQMNVFRGDGSTLLGSFMAPLNQWFYMEVKFKLHQTAGYIEIRIDGQTVFTFSGDTQQSSTANAKPTQIQWQPGSGGVYFQLDDMYLLDAVDATADQGRPYNDFLGPVRVEPLNPVAAGDPAGTRWAGSDGDSVDNRLLVDDGTALNTTDYIQALASGLRDLYEVENPSVQTGQVLAVDAILYAIDQSGGGTPIIGVVRGSDGTIRKTDAVPAPGSWLGLSRIFTKDAKNQLWTLAELNATQFGPESG